jgi:hypothetical protein
MAAQGRKLQVIDFSKQCCMTATHRRERVRILGRAHLPDVCVSPDSGTKADIARLMAK